MSGWEEMLDGDGVCFGDDENILEIEVMAAQHCECTKWHKIVYFDVLDFYVM